MILYDYDEMEDQAGESRDREPAKAREKGDRKPAKDREKGMKSEENEYGRDKRWKWQ